MRVEAYKTEAQSVSNRNPPNEDSIDEVTGVGYTHSSKVAEVGDAAIEFAHNILCDLDLPSQITLRLGNIRGLENARKAFIEMVGVVTVRAEFRTLSNKIVRIELPIPLYKGEFQKPSIVIYNSKRQVFSQDFIDEILGSLEVIRPLVNKPMTPSMTFQHLENVEKQMFAAPNDPGGFSLLVTERY